MSDRAGFGRAIPAWRDYAPVTLTLTLGPGVSGRLYVAHARLVVAARERETVPADPPAGPPIAE